MLLHADSSAVDTTQSESLAPLGARRRPEPTRAFPLTRARAHVDARPSGSVLADRFELLGTLGQGSSGTVYEAFDRDTRSLVAVKVLNLRAAHGVARLKHEARQLCRFAHPNLVAFHELIEHGGEWLFSMERVIGAPFTAALRATGQGCQLARLERTLPQLVAGVTELHERRLVHRDLKPSNVLVTPADRLVILDFGLVRSSQPGEREEGFAGTTAYAAPEQLRGGPVRSECDWYAVGVMLYEALTGSLPFRGTPGEQLQAKESLRLRAPSTLWPDVPAELERVCFGLLTPEPQFRLTGEALLAALARRDGARVSASAWTARSAPSGAPAPTKPDGPRPARGWPFVGRDTELSTLRTAFTSAAQQQATLAVVHGTSGMGKTSLIEQLLSELGDCPHLLLSARCNAHEQVPFQALDAIIEGLALHLCALPLARAAGLLFPAVHTLTELFPTLRQVRALAEVPLPAAAHPATALSRSEQAARALAQLLGALGQERPVVLSIDDLQAAKDDGTELLRMLLPLLHGGVLVLVTTRSPWRVDAPDLKTSEIALGPLPRTSSEQLVITRLGERARGTLAAQIANAALGHPLHAHELCTRARLTGQTQQLTLEAALALRLDALPPAQRAVLELLAVAKSPLDRKLLLDTLPAVSVADLRALDDTRLICAVRSAAGTLSYEPYHSQISGVVDGHLDASRRRALHTALATTYRELAHTQARAVWHYLAAGETAEAATLAGQAAEQAVKVHALGQAADLYLVAIEHTPRGARAQQLWEPASALLSATNRNLEAAQLYARRAGAAPPAERFDLERLAMENLFLAGRQVEGQRIFTRLARQVGLSLPNRHLLLLSCLLLSLRFLCFGLPRLCRADQVTQRQRQRAQLAWSSCAILRSDHLAWAHASLRGLRESARGGLRHEYLTLCVGWLAGIRASFGHRPRAEPLLIAEAEQASSGSPLQGWLHVAIGIYYVHAGALQRASEAFARAVSARPAPGFASARSFAESALLSSWFYQGDLRKIAAHVRAASPAYAADSSQTSSFAHVMGALASLAGDPERVERELRAIAASPHKTDGWWLAWIELFRGNSEAAYRHARSLPWRAGPSSLQADGMIALFVHGQVAAASCAHHPERRRELGRAIRGLRSNRHPWASAFCTLLAATEQGLLGEWAAASVLLEQAEQQLTAFGLYGFAAAAATRRGHLLRGEHGQLVRSEAARRRLVLGLAADGWLDVLTPGLEVHLG